VWFQRCDGQNREIATPRINQAVNAGCRTIVSVMNWGQPTFRDICDFLTPEANPPFASSAREKPLSGKSGIPSADNETRTQIVRLIALHLRAYITHQLVGFWIYIFTEPKTAII
jgi:hypothetical protein